MIQNHGFNQGEALTACLSSPTISTGGSKPLPPHLPSVHLMTR